MARKRKRKKRGLAPFRWWSAIDEDYRRRAVVGGVLLVGAGACLVTAAYGLNRLDQHVRTMSLEQHPAATVTFIDLPGHLASFAVDDLYASIDDLQTMLWTDDDLCREMADHLASVGWVERVNFVRKTSDAKVQVSAHYRYPVAMVQQGEAYFLVDGQGVRLPGSYHYDPTWKLVQGVEAAAPAAGRLWPGADIKAGLAVLECVSREPFVYQITAVDVANYAGRRDPYQSHIMLATDRAEGRIAWGSALGQEVEENLPEQKLALLRANYRETGRVDADHRVIDITTFSDRITIPG